MHSLLTAWLKLRDHLSEDFLGGPRVKAAWVINLQKGGTLPFVLTLMWHFDCFTPTALTYAALHGSYGLCWLMKDSIFPDPNWEKKITLASAFNSWALVLGLYWIAPILIVTERIEAPVWMLLTSSVVYVVGVVLMMGSDAQKYFTLKVKKGLITSGFFSRVRHPNYLGEMLLYGSFALLAQHWAPWAVLAWVWIGVFIPNMIQKETSMSRHAGWAAYKERSGFLLPFVGKQLSTKSTVPVDAPATLK
jgi:protein-S-isoprenylcysteine O-methyltransferase Ste14